MTGFTESQQSVYIFAASKPTPNLVIEADLTALEPTNKPYAIAKIAGIKLRCIH